MKTNTELKSENRAQFFAFINGLKAQDLKTVESKDGYELTRLKMTLVGLCLSD